MKIYHFCEDEKFIDRGIVIFESLWPGDNVYNIITHHDTLKLIKENNKHINIYKSAKDYILNSKTVFNNTDIVIFHSMAIGFYEILKNINPDFKNIVWFCYGFEVYNNPYLYPLQKLFDKETYKIYPHKLGFKELIKQRLITYYRLVKPKVNLSEIEKAKAALHRVNYLCSSFKEEHDNVCKIVGKKFKYFDFYYYPISMIVDVNYQQLPQMDTLLIGNSGTFSNNHLDVFHKIQNSNFKGHLLVPVSYGDQHYIKQIKAQGNLLFGQQIQFLEDFMTIDKYNDIISPSKFAVFNVRRQQAFGNIIAMLWFGSKVFISKKNTVYSYLKRLGVVVYEYEHEFNDKNLKEGLTQSEIENNRKLLLKELNIDKILKDIKLSVEHILKQND